MRGFLAKELVLIFTAFLLLVYVTPAHAGKNISGIHVRRDTL